MISFRSFSLVISVVLARQLALQSIGEESISSAAVRGPFNGLICGCVFFCVVAKFLPVIALLRADTVRRDQAWREMEQQRGWLEWMWLIAQSWLLTGTCAARALVEAEQAGWPQAIMMIAWFIPTLAFFAALEFGYTQLECMWSKDGDQSSLAHWTRWQTRVRLGAMGQIITCMLPVVVLLGTVQVLTSVYPGLSELWRGVLSLACLGMIGITLAPLWMRLWNGAKVIRADHPTAERVSHLCQRLGIVKPTVCVMDANTGWHGVAIVGWTPLFRQIWIGASVADGLTAEQLDMVLLHELAHLKRGHCWWRIIPLVIVGLTCVVSMTSWPATSTFGVGQVSVSLVFAVGMIWMLGVISRQCESDADRCACIYAAKHCSWADGQSSRAMTALQSALLALHDPKQNPRQVEWLHPSLAKRIAARL